VTTIFIFFFEIQEFCLEKYPAKQQGTRAAVWNSFLLIGLLLMVFMKREREDCHPFRHRNARGVRRLRTVSQVG